MEVRSQNELTGFGFAKDYDAGKFNAVIAEARGDVTHGRDRDLP